MFENFNLKIFFILIPLFCFSQEPIKWLTSVEKKSDNSYILSTTAKIQDNWRLYSQNLEEGGALPTEFVFEGFLPCGPPTIHAKVLSIYKSCCICSVKQMYLSNHLARPPYYMGSFLLNADKTLDVRI